MALINKENQRSGMKGYTVIWCGQLLSMLGSGMSRFAIMIWLWQVEGKATPFAIYASLVAIAQIIASPLAGVFVDRWNQKFTMALSDMAAGVSTVIILLLHTFGGLHLWHLYLLGAFAGFFGAFQFPAFSVAITTMVSKENYARAAGMGSLAGTISGIFSPLLAATLLEVIGIQGILGIDIITFIFAIGTLFFVAIPKAKVTETGLETGDSLWKEVLYGFKYIYFRKSLFGLLLVFLVVNLVFSFSSVLRTPLILARTGNDQLILGGVNSLTTIGGVVGGLLLMVWGGPKKKIRALFIAITAIGIGAIGMGFGQGLVLWAISGFVMMLSAIIANACSQAFWQVKVAPDVQGKVFSARSMISDIASPLSMLIAGPLADLFFEPKAIAGQFSWIVGVGPGAGISLMFIITGVMAIIVSTVGYLFETVREADTILPDYDQCEAVSN